MVSRTRPSAALRVSEAPEVTAKPPSNAAKRYVYLDMGATIAWNNPLFRHSAFRHSNSPAAVIALTMSTTFNHRTQPLVTKLLHWLMLPLLALVSTANLADTLRFERDGLTTSALGGGQDFLPVEQAYQLHPEVVNGELVMSWLIAPGYYLYRDSFSTAAVDPDGSQQPLEQHFQGGVTRYDEYFEKEVEVYYTATEVRASLPATAAAGVVRVQSQGCADAGLCYPPRTQYVTISGSALAVSDSPPGDIAPSSPGGSESLALILVFALLGGLILNLMPCVFPVL